MVKKIITVSLILFILLSIFIYVFVFNKKYANDARIAISPDASIIIKINNLKNFIHKASKDNEFWENLIKMKTFQNLNKEFLFIDSLIERNNKIEEVVKNEPFYLSIHNMGVDKYLFVSYLTVNEKINYKFISEVLTKKIKSQTVKNYSGEKIITIITNDYKSYSYCITKGIFIFSESSILLEKAIRHAYLNNSILDDREYLLIDETASNYSDANIYFNHNNIPRFIVPILNKRYDFIGNKNNYANYTELDVNIKSNGILLTGLTYSNDSLNNYIDIFKSQEPVKLAIDQVIPSVYPVFLAVGINNFEKYINDYKNYLKLSGKVNNYNSQINNINKKYGINVIDLFNDILNNEIGYLEGDDIKDNLIIIETKSESLAKEKFIQIINKDIEFTKKRINDYTYQYKIDNETIYIIYKSPILKIPELVFGDLFSSVDCNYFSFINNYLVFGNNIKSISDFIHYNILRKTYSNEQSYIDFSEYQASHYNFYFYLNTPKAKKIFSKYLSLKISNSIEKEYENIRKFSSFSFQFSVEKEMYYNNIYLNYSSEFKEKPRTEWETRLDTTMDFKPQLVLNHYTKDKEIFIQDYSNNIYLINKTGRILWKLKLDEQIRSEVFQVDFYKNGKLQLLFSTDNYLHLIDRNGNYVENYPIKLRSKATNPMNLFDYENNKDYRIFIACENKKVYAYNIKGNIISGWKFDKSDNYVKSIVQFFRVLDKDYLVFADNYKIYILNRKGSVRINPEMNFSKSKNNIFHLDLTNSKHKPRIVTTDVLGNIYFIYFDGKVEKTRIKNYTENHYFDYEDINGDNYKDFIFLDNKLLSVYNYNKKLIYDYEFKSELFHPPVCYNFGRNNIKIGVVSKSTKEIYLINNNGTIYKNFPLNGTSLFSIGLIDNSNTKFNLFVGNDDIFLYNYSIQ